MNDGWVKLSDPATGKEFYANKSTRQTQWDPPPGFADPATATQVHSHAQSQGQSHGYDSFNNRGSVSENDNKNDNENWEQMKDEASGRYFYVDHVSKVTTWERPTNFGRDNSNAKEKTISSGASHSFSANSYGHDASGGNEAQGTATGFGFIPAGAMSGSAYGTSPNTSSAPTPKHSNANVSPWGESHPPPSTAHSHVHSHSASYEYSYKPSTNTIDDKSTKYYSSMLPQIDFKVVKVPDRLRPSCPSCDITFSLSKRRHHCRLCGDVFCDACSSHRVLLPLGGTEFDKPVRVCKECHVDVDKDNFFSMRRYLTPLLLYNGENEEELQKAFGNMSNRKNDDGSAVESIDVTNVSAALTALTQDLESVLQDSTSFGEKVTIPPDILIPAITRHLTSEETSDRAMKALSVLLSLGNVVGDNSFAATVFLHKNAAGVLENICKLLEWSGTGTKTLAVQEQAAKAIFYLTDGRVLTDILEMEEANGHFFDEGWINSAVMLCDAPRVLRSMLDHTTSTESPTLQRWSAACIRSLISEDERRCCEAVSEAMSMGYNELRYESFVTELVSSGGAMILSSLVSSDDSDTRGHAMAALSQIIDAARNINVRLGVFIEAFQIQNIQTCSETSIIEAVVSSGACGPSLAQLLLSADNSSAAMACDFARSLVYPILSNPLGTSVPRYHRLFASNVNLEVDEDGLKEYRKAALGIGASDGVLGALIHLVTDIRGGGLRPVELRRSAMQILAAISHTVAYWDSKIKNCGKAIETMDDSVLRLHEKVGIVLTILEEERAAEAITKSFSSATIDSLNTSRDSPSSQLKEASALTVCALSSCSLSMANTFISSNILASLISICADEGFNTPSRRGNWSSRRLPMLEAVAAILVQGWKMMQTDVATRMLDEEGVGSGSSSRSLELLLEALDAGIVPLISRILNSAQDFSTAEKGYADTRTKIAACHCVSAMFGIGRGDETNIGFSRIFEAMGNRHRIISQILYLLGSIVPEVQNNASQGRSIEKDIPLLQLLEANLLSTGSICGSEFCSFGSMNFHGDYDMSPGLGATGNDVFATQFQEICATTSDIINKNSFLPSALVGVFGEGSAMPILRIVSVVAENGSTKRVHQQLVRSGVLLPLTDMLRDAMNAGDYYIFDACVVTIGHAGPQMNSSSANNSISALRDCVKLFANVLLIEDRSGGASGSKKLDSLKIKCIKAVEMLSSNSSLWTVIVAHFVPGFMDKWLTADKLSDTNPHTISLVCAGLQTILRVISLPTHAVFIANTGIAASLSNIICHDNSSLVGGGRVEEFCIQILHVLLSYSGKKGPSTERIDPGVVDIYALDVACSLLSRETHVDHNDGMTNTKLGLEIVLRMISGLEDIEQAEMPQSPRIIGFVETVSSNREFLKKLCATLLSFDPKEDHPFELSTSVRSIYGTPIFLFEGACGPFMKSADAAMHILFWIAFYASIAHSQNSTVLWETFMLDDEDISDQSSKHLATCAASANFLGILSKNGSSCLPINQAKLQFYKQTAQPVVQERLLHVLSVGTSGFLAESDDEEENVVSFRKLLSCYRAPQLCLELANNVLLLEQAFKTLQHCVSGFPRSLLDDIVSDKVSLASLFNLLALSEDKVSVVSAPNIGTIRVFAAAILSSAGELNVLGPAVNREGLRGFAVASLSAACLTDDDQSETLAEDLTEEGSSMSMLCLHGLVDVLSSDSRKDCEVKVMLSPSEAHAISTGLAKKLSSMVLERFMHKAEREHVLGEISGGEAIQRFPEVTLLCALASSKEALTELCDNGGLEALSLVAGEGELSAITALLEVCKVDPNMVISVDAHVSALHVISKDSDYISPAAKKGCFELLVQISASTREGRDAISTAEECAACIEYASHLIKGLAQENDNDNETSNETKEESDSTNISVDLEALSFLSSLVPNENCRAIILVDEELEASIENLAKNSQRYEVQQAAILYLGCCARFIKYDCEDARQYAEGMSSSLLLILDSSQIRRKSRHIATSSGRSSFGDFSKSHQINENLILASTCKVLETLIPNMPCDTISKVLHSLSTIWSDTLNFHMLSSKKTASKTRNSGIVMFNMSAILLITVGRNEIQELVNTSATVTNLLRFALLDPDKVEQKSKQSEVDDSLCDLRHWQAALSQSLQCLATLTTNSNFKTEDGKCWDEIVTDVESKTTSKQASKIRSFGFTSQTASPSQTLFNSLDRLANNMTDPMCSIVASRVKENLFG